MFPFHLLPIEMQAAAAAIGMFPKLDFVEPDVTIVMDVGVDLPDWAEDNASIQHYHAEFKRKVMAAGLEFMRDAEPHLCDEAKRESSRNIERLASFGFTSEFLLKCCEPAFAMAVLERMLTRRQQQVVDGLQDRISGLQGALDRQHEVNTRLRQRATSAEALLLVAEGACDEANRRATSYEDALKGIRKDAAASKKLPLARKAGATLDRLARQDRQRKGRGVIALAAA